MFSPSSVFADNNNTQIFVNQNEVKFSEPLFIQDGRLYVPVRFISEQMGSSIYWNDKTNSVKIGTQNGDEMKFTIDSSRMFLNGRDYFIDAPPIIRYGRTYLSIRHVSEFMHTRVKWDNETESVYLKEIPVHIVQPQDTLAILSERYNTTVELLKERNGLKENKIYVGQTLKVVIPKAISYHPDLDLLAKLIQAESGGEAFAGKLAVGNVIMNRVEDERFPNTIKGVIYQPNQFTPVKTGRINEVTPGPTAIEAAERAYAGEKPVGDALFFFNPSLTDDTFLRERQYIAKIGNHQFLR